MTVQVVTTHADAPVREATRVLLEHRVAALPVVDDDGRLVGIVSELDLLRDRLVSDPRSHVWPPVSQGPPPPRTVADVMTREVYALTEADDAATFADLMAESGVKSVPVVRGERVVGVVGRRDLLRRLARDDADVRADVEALLAAEAAVVGQWTVAVDDGQVRLSGAGSAEGARLLALSVPGVVRVTTG